MWQRVPFLILPSVVPEGENINFKPSFGVHQLNIFPSVLLDSSDSSHKKSQGYVETEERSVMIKI